MVGTIETIAIINGALQPVLSFVQVVLVEIAEPEAYRPRASQQAGLAISVSNDIDTHVKRHI